MTVRITFNDGDILEHFQVSDINYNGNIMSIVNNGVLYQYDMSEIDVVEWSE